MLIYLSWAWVIRKLSHVRLSGDDEVWENFERELNFKLTHLKKIHLDIKMKSKKFKI